jgi:hypothetical protein
LPDVILSGFSFTKGTNEGPAAKATALTVAVKDRTRALDTNFSDTGELINPSYGEAVLARVHSTGDVSNSGAASDLYIVYGTAGTYASALSTTPLPKVSRTSPNPPTTQIGTFTVPSDFASMQGTYTFDSRGQILVSGDTTNPSTARILRCQRYGLGCRWKEFLGQCMYSANFTLGISAHLHTVASCSEGQDHSDN